MKTYRIALLAGLALGVAQPAFAQAVPATKIAIVDLERIGTDCNACKVAAAALQQQLQAYESRRQQLANQLQPEENYLQTAVNALNGKDPDAVLGARIKAFQQNQANAAQELQRMQTQIQRNQQYVQYQVVQKLQPLYATVMNQRGANVLVESANTLAISPSLDITNDLLTALNAALPSLVTTAPPPQQAGQAPAPAPAPVGGKPVKPATKPAGPQPEGR